MNYIEGKILTPYGFKRGHIVQKDKEPPTLHLENHLEKGNKKYLIIPTLINAHTHIGDTFIRKKNIQLPQNIMELVAPPDGLKHRLLKKTNPNEIQQGIMEGLKELKQEGISTFVDFRENGIAGINILKNAMKKNTIHSIILGRPDTKYPSKKQINEILENADGIGLSSIQDLPFESANIIAEETKKHNKIFALHASERVHEQIKPIFDLNPDFIVHMTKASNTDLHRAQKKGIPLVVCPRSNHFFGMKPNLINMKKNDNVILLGTDNFMFHQPSLIKEIQYIQTHFPDIFTLEELFMMVTYHARKALNLKDNIPGSTFPSSWIIINPDNYQIETIIKKVEEG